MPSYLIFSFLAVVCFALSFLFSKFVSKHKIDNRDSLMAYFMLSMFLFSLVLFPFVKKTIPSFLSLTPLIIAMITFLIGYYFFFTGIQKTDASVFTPLFQLQAALIALLAFVFLGERFPAQNYLWMLLMIFGAILVSLDEKMNLRSFLNKGILAILATQLFHAVSNLFVGFSLQRLHFLQFAFWEYLIIGVLLIPFILIARPKLNYPKKDVFQFSIGVLISAVGALFLFKAFEDNLTISSVIAMMSSPIVFFITVIASRIKPSLLEHHSPKVYLIRFVGILLILSGAIKLSIG